MASEIYFESKTTPILKFVAIVLMFFLHLLKTEWMTYPELIVDFHIGSVTLSSILSNGGNICIGIFAFISGYGWATSFDKKSKISRIFGGGGYRTYWVVLIVFAFPVRFFMEVIIGGLPLNLSTVDLIRSLTALSSSSVKFGWYIYFYALAIISFEPARRITDRIRVNGWVKMLIICILCLGLRFACQIIFSRIVLVYTLRDIGSHYFQWMPVIISGYIVAKDALFEQLYCQVHRIKQSAFITLCLLVCIVLYSGKCFVQLFINNYSNVDSFYLPIFMFSLIGATRMISGRWYKMISWIGLLSPYLWLTHRILLYPLMNKVILSARIPLLVLIVSFIIMIPIGLVMRRVDSFAERVCCTIHKKSLS